MKHLPFYHLGVSRRKRRCKFLTCRCQQLSRKLCGSSMRTRAIVHRRLARALAISGAPAQAIVAAKRLKCAICDEKRQPKTRRPATLPVPKDVSDQVHVDIFEAVDALGRNFYVIHAADFTSRFQMAEVVRQKSSDEIVTWFTTRWLPVFGPPRALVADQGREFISYAFEEMCARHSILLWHTAVQALIDDGHRPNLMRQMALRETAKVAMTRLHFSRGLRRAEVARSRSTTTTHQQQLEPGMIVYFFRNSKYNNKTSPSKKRLSLRRWHGPALLIAKERQRLRELQRAAHQMCC